MITAVEGPKIWYDLFLYDLENQQYTYKGTQNQIGIIGPMVREIRLLDITVPEQNLEDLLADLGPYVREGASKQKLTAGVLKKMAWLVGKVSKIFKGVELKPIPDVKPSNNLRRKALNIMPLTWFEDPVQQGHGLILPQKDGGGELL